MAKGKKDQPRAAVRVWREGEEEAPRKGLSQQEIPDTRFGGSGSLSGPVPGSVPPKSGHSVHSVGKGRGTQAYNLNSFPEGEQLLLSHQLESVRFREATHHKVVCVHIYFSCLQIFIKVKRLETVNMRNVTLGFALATCSLNKLGEPKQTGTGEPKQTGPGSLNKSGEPKQTGTGEPKQTELVCLSSPVALCLGSPCLFRLPGCVCLVSPVAAWLSSPGPLV